MDARVLTNASKGHCSGHKDFWTICMLPSSSGSSFSNMAGNSTTSYWSESSFITMSLTTRPVKSFNAQRVCTMATRPPGIRRVRAPVVNHSYALSNTSRLPLMMSCSLCGSSISNRSAPRPAMAPPTPTAKYSPP